MTLCMMLHFYSPHWRSSVGNIARRQYGELSSLNYGSGHERRRVGTARGIFDYVYSLGNSCFHKDLFWWPPFF